MPPNATPGPAFVIPPRAVELAKQGNFVEAARITRAAFLAAVAEAKVQAEQQRPERPARSIPPAAPHTHRHSGQVTPTPFRHAPGLSPGELPRESNAGVWVAVFAFGVALIIAAVLMR